MLASFISCVSCMLLLIKVSLQLALYLFFLFSLSLHAIIGFSWIGIGCSVGTVEYSSAFFFFDERKVYNVGTTNKVSTRANNKPPTITTPNGMRLLPAEPMANAIGNAPKVVANVVIRI